MRQEDEELIGAGMLSAVSWDREAPTVAPGREDVLSPGALDVQVEDGEPARRLHEGLPIFAEYLGFGFEELDEAELSRMFAATEEKTKGDDFPVTAEKLRRNLLTVSKGEILISSYVPYRVRDRHGNPIFVAALGTSHRHSPEGEACVSHHFNTLSVRDAGRWESVYPEEPGAAALCCMLATYAQRRECAKLTGTTNAYEKIPLRGFVMAATRTYYAALGMKLVNDGIDALPALGSEKAEAMWWRHLANSRFVHTTSYLEWFGEEPREHGDAAGVEDAVLRMSAGTIKAPETEDDIHAERAYYRDVCLLETLWHSLSSRVVKKASLGVFPRSVKMDCTPEEFFASNGGPEMISAVCYGVPIADVIA